MIRTKRAYVPPDPGDGERILVDRLWPRGLSKSRARIDRWMKDLGPSTELRTWFHHDATRWEEFQRRYRHELASPDKRRMLVEIARESEKEPVTLVYGSRDTEHNNAKVILDELELIVDQDGGPIP